MSAAKIPLAKYLVLSDGDEELIFIFPVGCFHIHMADGLRATQPSLVRYKPISAGFISPAGEVFGSSETLGLESRPQDQALLPRFSAQVPA